MLEQRNFYMKTKTAYNIVAVLEKEGNVHEEEEMLTC